MLKFEDDSTIIRPVAIILMNQSVRLVPVRIVFAKGRALNTLQPLQSDCRPS